LGDTIKDASSVGSSFVGELQRLVEPGNQPVGFISDISSLAQVGSKMPSDSWSPEGRHLFESVEVCQGDTVVGVVSQLIEKRKDRVSESV
jgi:hypothetical protein